MALRNTLAWGAMIAGALAITYNFAPQSGKMDLIEPDKRHSAADFKLVDANGAEVKLSDYKDKVVLLNFWATWCGPCQVEIPWFKEFEQTYKDRGFAVVGVSADEEGWAAVKPYIEAKKLNYRVLLDDQKMPSPYKDVQALPSTYFIDRQGRIAGFHEGLVSKGTYEDGIQALLRN
ncbi:MAG: TlpA disulfide reductase family protein [Acidobacteriota bacterium]